MKTKKYTIEHNNTDVRKLWNLAKTAFSVIKQYVRYLTMKMMGLSHLIANTHMINLNNTNLLQTHTIKNS